MNQYDKIFHGKQCIHCKNRIEAEEPAFIVNGTHFFCQAEFNADGDPACIDGYYWEPAGNCIKRVPAQEGGK